MNSVLILIANPPVACTKTFSIRDGKPVKTSDYPDLFLFGARNAIANDIDDLAYIVEHHAKIENTFILRGALSEFGLTEIDDNRMIRRRKAVYSSDPAPIEEAPLSWVMLD